jgi:putative glutamine amidotransferase
MSRPVIGVSGNLSYLPELARKPTLVTMKPDYLRGVMAAGGLPVVIPPLLDAEQLREVFARLDGLLLTGGGDIDPAVFGQDKHPATDTIVPERDQSELTLARWALAEDKPMLAVCRGIQVMNVAAGGALIQDIPTQVEHPLTHSFGSDVARDTIAHAVRVDPNSRLARILGSTEAGVNSWHHQACQTPGQGLVYTAWAPDGVVEAAEAPAHRLAVGVQWHPEDLFYHRADMLALFRALVEAAQ